MAHLLMDLANICDKISEKLDVADPPSLTLIELLANGRLRTLPVTEELVETYVEKDFLVSRWHVLDYSS